MNRIRVGAVSYLNTKPLVFGMDSRADELDVVYDLPSRLADRLAENELDVALIPVIEAIANPTYTIVSNACIACRGPVLSVKLFGRVEPEQITSLALDEGSRTSAALARIILKRKFGVEPELETLPISRPWRDSKSDAVLVIGDRAMENVDPAGDDFHFIWDLGDYWNSWTSLPFVFAVWAARPGVNLHFLEKTLGDARDQGLESLEKICTNHRQMYGMEFDECYNYLSKNLHFRLGQQERQGLSMFCDYAKEQNVISRDLSLQFHDCQAT